MNTYPSYKDSGYGWIGEIPSHWKIGKLKHFSHVNPTKNSGLISKDSNELVTFLPMEKVNADGTYDVSLKHPIKELWNGFTYFEENDVIVAKITPCFENGKGALLQNLDGQIGFGSTEFHVLRALPEISQPKFLYYLTQSHLFKTTGEAFMYGAAGQKRVPTSHLTDFPFSCPPLPEQQVIADFLDRKTEKIDTLIEKKQQQIDVLLEQHTALINHAVTKGLNPSVKTQDTGVEWLGEIPSHWEFMKTKYLFRLVTEKAPDDNGMELLSLYTEIGVRPRKDLEARGNKASTTDGYWIVKEGDIVINKLLAWMGAVGYSAYDGVTSPAYDILRKVVPLNSKFYHYFFRCGICLPEFKRRSRGIMEMRLRLYFDELGQIPLVYPSETEQNQIVEYLDELEDTINRTMSKITKEIELLQEYRMALISESVTGKIDVKTAV